MSRDFRGWRRSGARIFNGGVLLRLLAALAAFFALPSAASANICNYATSGSGTYASTVCWLDFTGYVAGTTAQNFTFDLTGPYAGYRLTLTVKQNSGPSIQATPPQLRVFGGNYYTNIAGRPLLIGGAGSPGNYSFTISNIIVRNIATNAVVPFALVFADNENTDNSENFVMTTTSSWRQMEILTLPPNPVPTLSIAGTTLTWQAPASSSSTGSFLASTPSPTSVAIASKIDGAEGFVVGVMLTRLTLRKTVINDNGGTALASAWTLSGSGPTAISGATGSTAVTDAVVAAGSYSLTESATPTGYTASNYSCTKNGGVAVSGNSIALNDGDSAICTITNNDTNEVRLSITKSNGTTQLVSGTTTTYTITANNAGPASADGATVQDSPGTGLSGCLVQNCTGSNGATCPATPANIMTGPTAIPTFPANSSVTFQVRCNVT